MSKMDAISKGLRKFYQTDPRAIEVRKQMSERMKLNNPNKGQRLAECAPCWKGDKVGYDALHHWIRKHNQKPDLCQICFISPPRDLANITGIYNRDFKNWMYLCRRCHMRSDGRLMNLKQFRSP